MSKMLSVLSKLMPCSRLESYTPEGQRRQKVRQAGGVAEIVRLLREGYWIPVNSKWQVQLGGDSDLAKDILKVIKQGHGKIVSSHLHPSHKQQYLTRDHES